jgi:3-dehydroquinate dehydratase-1
MSDLYMASNHPALARILEHRPLICTSILSDNKKSFFENLNKAIDGGTDMAELRIDAFRNVQGENFNDIISEARLPLIVTNRNRENRGQFPGDEESRLALLRSCLAAKPAFVDIEFFTEDKNRMNLMNTARDNGVGVICSYHDFNGTPSPDEIIDVYRRISNIKPDMVKMVFTTHTNKDALNILEATEALQNEKILFTLFGMGKRGQITRMLCPLLGASLTYCALDSASATNTGLYQLSLENTKSLIRIIERKGWKYMKENHNDIMKMAAIELNDDSSLSLTSINRLMP